VKAKAKCKAPSRRRVRIDRRPRMWHLIGLAAAAVVVMSVLDWPSGTDEPLDGWYRLKSIVPGERVPDWLHTGFTYRGILSPDRQLVRIFAPDSALTAVVSAALVMEVAGPS
jgi:hypothetical protein